jgi:glucose-1-phosphate cytidylyltransferase
MKAVILAGGLGTRIAEETHLRPKPMVEIGGRPILWHILKIYSHYGIHDFVICCGYKGYVIKEYFANYALHSSDVSFDLARGSMEVHRRDAEPWRVTLVDTGEGTATGGRLRRVAHHLDDGPFCLTYGDGVGNVDVAAVVALHRSHGRMATVTAVQPPGRYGSLELDAEDGLCGVVTGFSEKPPGDGQGNWINAGFFVLEPKVLDLIEGDHTTWEFEPLQRLAQLGELRAWRHHGFWRAMDTLRDRNQLEELWASGRAPWKLW